MALEQRTIIDQIEAASNGAILVRFAILILNDGAIVSRRWHRTSILPGEDIDAVLAAVDQDITTRPTLMAAPVDKVHRMDHLRGIVQTVHTPEVVEQHRQRVEKRRIKEEK